MASTAALGRHRLRHARLAPTRLQGRARHAREVPTAIVRAKHHRLASLAHLALCLVWGAPVTARSVLLVASVVAQGLRPPRHAFPGITRHLPGLVPAYHAQRVPTVPWKIRVQLRRSNAHRGRITTLQGGSPPVRV